MSEKHFAPLPTAVYGFVLLCSAFAYTILQMLIISHHKSGENDLAAVVGHDLKSKLSIVLYVVAIISAFINQWISDVIYVSVAAMWIIPDPRIEKRISHQQHNQDAQV